MVQLMVSHQRASVDLFPLGRLVVPHGCSFSCQPVREDTTAHVCFPAPGSAASWEKHGRAAKARRPRHMSPSQGSHMRASVVHVVGAPDGAGRTRGL